VGLFAGGVRTAKRRSNRRVLAQILQCARSLPVFWRKVEKPGGEVVEGEIVRCVKASS
jgi:hypothetical protein